MSDRMSPRGRSKKATKEDVVKAARQTEDPCIKKGEVAQKLPIGGERTRMLMNELVEEDVLKTKSVGSGRIYWFPCA